MRKTLLVSLITLTVTLLLACGAGSARDENPSAKDECAVTGGEPGKCPDGCIWNGSACKPDRGIVVPGTPTTKPSDKPQ